MDDKKDYKAVLKGLEKLASAQTVLNQLTDVLLETEDVTLKPLVKNVINLLRSTAKQTTMKVCLARIDTTAFPTHMHLPKAVLDAANYCSRCLNASVPQWQILALNAGWAPPSL